MRIGLGMGMGLPFASAGGGAPIATTSQSSVTDNGVTFTFSKAMPVGQFVDGSYFVVADSAFQITGTTPASAIVNSGWAHGMAQDPYLTTSQPFDQFIASGNASADIPYSGNIDPGATGSAISIASGAKASFIKSVRRSAMTSADGSWQTVDKYVVLTVLDAAPLAGSYRPGVASTTKSMLNRNNFNANSVRSLTLPASFTDTPSQALAKVPSNIGLFGLTNGEQARRLRLDVALGTTSSNYSAEIAKGYSNAILQLHRSGLSSTDRDAILARIALFASDLAGLAERGWTGNANRGTGAGQSGAIQPWLFAAAFAFNSSAMLTAAQSFNTSMLANAFWISSADFSVVTNGKSGVFAQAYFDEHVTRPWVVPDEETTDVFGRYTSIAAHIMSHEIPVVALFQNGPSGTDGLSAMLNGANDTTNPRAAAVAFMSERRQWDSYLFAAWAPDTGAAEKHDLVASLVSGFSWTGSPQQIPYSAGAGYDDPWFTGGDGSIAYDVSALDFATETVTRYDIRYSLDRRSWVQSDNVGASGSVSGLLKGKQHFVQMRRQSASGLSPWSSNHPRVTPIAGEPARGAPTTTGTASNAAPANTLAPVLMRNTRKNWEWGLWEIASSYDATDFTISAGSGYWTGFPAPTITFQWKRNGTNISGATSQDYVVVNADYLQSLSCDVIATNGSGAITVTTNAMTVNAFVPGEGFLDTFATDTSSNYTLLAGATVVYNSGAGELEITSNGTSFAGVRSQLFTVVSGTTYTISAVVTAITGSVILDMITTNSAGTTLASSPATSPGRISAPGTLSWTWVPGAGVTSARVVLRNRNATTATFKATSISVAV